MYLKSLLLLCLIISQALAAPRFDNPWMGGLTSRESMHPHCRGVFSLDDDSLHFYDARKIEAHISVNLDPDNHGIFGNSVIKLHANQFALDRVDLRLSQSLAIDSVWSNENYIVVLDTVGLDSLQIYLSPPLNVGDSVDIGIAYHGLPPNIDSWGGFKIYQASSWKPQIGYSLGDGLNLEPPPANYNWLPCFSDPNDKLSFESWLTVRTGKTANSNGVRLDTLQNNDSTTTWHYRIDQPISTYLIFVAVSDYVIQTQRASNPLIENFVYPSRTTQAQTHFSNVPAVLDEFSNLFGTYPFDRFGYTMARQGDMEHATSIAHTDQTVVPNHSYDWLLFHELSHQWWGDWVSLGDWRDLWLSEGFATYGEALGLEITLGREGYMNYVVNTLFPDGRAATDSYSIYDPDYYWGNSVYGKGACVLYMLREIMGDSSFFAGLRAYGQEFAFDNAVTADFQRVMEEHYGNQQAGDLNWFFQPWVYGTRYPRYRVSMEIGDFFPVTIEQIQTTETLFSMPLELQVVNTDNDTFQYRIWNDAVRSQGYILGNDSLSPFWGTPHTIVLDPNQKVLKTVVYQVGTYADEQANLPQKFDISSLYPNPFNPQTTVVFDLPQSSNIKLRVFNLEGQLVTHEDLGYYSVGSHKIDWDGAKYASGIYFFQIESINETRFAKAFLLK